MNSIPPAPSAVPEPQPLPTGTAALTELALDLRWTWNHCSDALWKKLDPELWELTHHPSELLQNTSREKVLIALDDPDFCDELKRLMEANHAAETAPAWFQKSHPEGLLTCVAYFCMEYMLTEALPIYSGGLGNVAGDQLKAASDLGVPVVGIGLLYQHGYFRQVIDHDGNQQAIYPFNNPSLMPITPVLTEKGEPLRLEIILPGGPIFIRVWKVKVGRCTLYLLDTNDAANAPFHRAITSDLYGGGPEIRLKQEMLLGIGGWRLLRALGLRPEVCHLNEGHAALVVLERARAFMEENGKSFEVSLAATRTGNIFTTHTAVSAGFDVFPPSMVEQYLGWYAREHLKIPLSDLLALGRVNPNDSNEPFNMAYLAVRGSNAVNGVSKLHGRVSRHLFAPLFPHWPEDEIPIGHITNGIHVPTWDSDAADRVWTDACGKNRWDGLCPGLAAGIRRVSDESLQALRTESRAKLVAYAQDRLGRQMAAAGADAACIQRTQARIRPTILTLGFARRFASYKRPNLLLTDPERLLRILRNRERPVQLILAGKAHPADAVGKALIKGWTTFLRSQGEPTPVVFLADYDMLLAEHMVQGIDVWINTPRRPWEASGTSGMKILVNGGLNISELDGWWAEAYLPDVGWALGDGEEHGDDPSWDAAEADALYDRLENEVIPEYYERDDFGLPRAWLARVRESMARLTPRFSASQTVREYTENRYLPAAVAYRARAADNGADAERLVAARSLWSTKRGLIAFGKTTITNEGGHEVISVPVFLGENPPATVVVELYADAVNGHAHLRKEMQREPKIVPPGKPYLYRASVPHGRPLSDYTPRVHGLGATTEDNWVLWQK